MRGRTKGSKGRIIIKRRDYNERPEPYRIYDHREGIATEIRIRREGQRCWRCVHFLIKADESYKKKMDAAVELAMIRPELKE